jgi:hypothetical protein
VNDDAEKAMTFDNDEEKEVRKLNKSKGRGLGERGGIIRSHSSPSSGRRLP